MGLLAPSLLFLQIRSIITFAFLAFLVLLRIFCLFVCLFLVFVCLFVFNLKYESLKKDQRNLEI